MANDIAFAVGILSCSTPVNRLERLVLPVVHHAQRIEVRGGKR